MVEREVNNGSYMVGATGKGRGLAGAFNDDAVCTQQEVTMLETGGMRVAPTSFSGPSFLPPSCPLDR